MSDKPRDMIIKEWESRLPDLVKWIDAHTTPDRKAPISPDVVSAISVIILYESSKKIESYSRVLTWLTLALVVLTGVLAVRTLLP